MDLYQLRYFLEVARELNFTRAARQLGVTPPAVSKSVALLERSLGRPLFRRSRRRVELTREGEALRARVEAAFDLLEAGRREARGGEAQDPPMLRIGSREMITNHLLPGPLKLLRERHPRTRFGLHELEPRRMTDALAKDRLDLAFYYSSDVPGTSLEIRHLGSLRSHVYAAPRLAGRSRSLRGLPFVAPRYFDSDPSLPSADGFPDARLEREIVFEAELLETHRQFVLAGLCAGVIPDFLMEDELRRGRVVRLPGPPLGREIYFLKRKGRLLPPIVSELVEALEALLRGPRGKAGPKTARMSRSGG